MSKQIWFKGQKPDKEITKFTVGRDRDIDNLLAPYEILASLAHVRMLVDEKLVAETEGTVLTKELKQMYREVSEDGFKLPATVEDIHSYVEQTLTERIGLPGKKLHQGRSRNDLVLVDLKMYVREKIRSLVNQTQRLFNILLEHSEANKDVPLPGYTHMQVAMPSSFGLWFGAYAESLVDDLLILQAAFKVVNKSPLGSAAGYGSSFPINRSKTAALLGFDRLHINAVYAQMCRGKTERITAQALANLAGTLNKLANDCILFMSQNFNFISFPDNLTTGSSIMPHKKNPDVWEMMRAKTGRIIALQNQIQLTTHNLYSGYHRDLQLIKEHFVPALDETEECITMAAYMLKQIQVHPDILENDVYRHIYSVEVVQQLTQKGMSFRDAYLETAKRVENGNLQRPSDVAYTHEGSMGNLCNPQIERMMQEVLAGFDFDTYQKAIKALLE